MSEYVIWLKSTQCYVGWEWGQNQWGQFQRLAAATAFPSRDRAEKVLASLQRYAGLKPFIVPVEEAHRCSP
jgi:hypothetical protein